MHVITQKRIWEAQAKWPRSATALEAWYRLMKASAPLRPISETLMTNLEKLQLILFVYTVSNAMLISTSKIVGKTVVVRVRR